MKKTINYLLALGFLGLGINLAHAETKYVTENLSTYYAKAPVINIKLPAQFSQAKQ